MAHTTPQVREDMLTFNQGTRLLHIVVGSEDWWRWLSLDETTIFYFQSAAGHFTARRERKNGNWYWYAYRKQQRKLHKAYIGKTSELLATRLQHIAAVLNNQTDRSIAEQEISLSSASPISIEMGQQVQELASASPSSFLLSTKLMSPPARGALVERQRLFTYLDTGLQRTLTLLSAPAGFGKTTLLSSWLSQTGLDYAWLSLDKEDNDPIRFWSYVVAALARVQLEVKTQVLPLLQVLPQSSIHAILTILINTLAQDNVDRIMILDDYHLVEAIPIHEGVSFLLEHAPTNLHLIIASRVDPPLPLTRLRARGQLQELRVNDLRFSLQEVTTFLEHATGALFSPEQVAALDIHTEGWIAGLQLAALSLQNQPHIDALLSSFTGSHRYILDYLTDEVLHRQPEPVRDFLLQSAIPERLCADLCNALTDRDDGQAMLERVEQANLFLIPLDQQRRWYRYHHLFADFLRERLRHDDPELYVQLQLRAAKWHERHDLIVEAVNHAMLSQDVLVATQLVERHAEKLMMSGEVTTFLSWIAALPDELLKQRPHLRIYHIGGLISIGQLDAAEYYLREIEYTIAVMKATATGDEIAEVERVEREFIATSAVYEGFRGENMLRTIELSRQALHLLPPHESFMRSIIASGLGNAYLISGVLEQAYEAFGESVTAGLAAGHRHAALVCLAAQGYIQFISGHLRQATETYERVLKLAEEPDGQCLSAASVCYAFYAEVLYDQNHLEQAERYAREAIALGKRWEYVGTWGAAYCSLALIHAVHGRMDEALTMIDQLMFMVQEHNIAIVTTSVAAYRSLLHAQAGDIEEAKIWVQSLEERGFIGPFTIFQDMELLILARIYLMLGRLQDARLVLNRVHEDVTVKCYASCLIDCLVQLSLVEQAEGNGEQALATMARAVAQAEPEGYVRLIIDKGEAVERILRQLAARRRNLPYVKHLLTAFNRCEEEQDVVAQSDDILSEREIHLLRCISRGKSNQEIARELVIAVSTVKTHLSHIYTKLAVHNRTHALARARELGLLR